MEAPSLSSPGRAQSCTYTVFQTARDECNFIFQSGFLRDPSRSEYFIIKQCFVRGCIQCQYGFTPILVVPCVPCSMLSHLSDLAVNTPE